MDCASASCRKEDMVFLVHSVWAGWSSRMCRMGADSDSVLGWAPGKATAKTNAEDGEEKRGGRGGNGGRGTSKQHPRAKSHGILHSQIAYMPYDFLHLPS